MSAAGEREDPLQRLSRAVDAFLAYREGGGEARDAFLSRNDELRDLLEPMLDQERTPAADGSAECRYLGDFRLVREIGRGGMGVVYDAVQVSLGRRVALKVLPAHLTLSPSQIERFRREATSAARLRHPGIVPIHSVGEHEGAHFFAMELVEGRDLREALESVKRGTASGLGVLDGQSFAAEAAEVIAQAAEALHHAHQHGVIHRDVKPQNILLGADRKVRLVDFGLAKELGRESLSRTREFAGTPQYVSPEQALGKHAQIDGRTDVFSLGVVLYEILARRGPFEAESTEQALSAVVTREPPRLRKCNVRVPGDLETVCLKALEKKPDHRYASAGELAADLRRFLRHEPIQATRPSLFSRGSKLVRRRWAWTATTAAGLALAVLAVAFWIHGAGQQAQARRHLESARTALHQLADVVSELNDAPGSSAAHVVQVEELVKTYDELISSSQDPELRCEACRAYNLASDLYQALGHRDRQMAMSTRAVAVARALVERFPGQPQYRYELARAYFNRSLARESHEVPAQRQTDLHASIELFEGLVALATAPSLVDHSKRALAVAYVSSAINARLAAPGAAPEPAAQQWLERALSLIGELPAHLRDREPRALYELAHVYAGRNQLDEAVETLERAVEKGEALLSEGTTVRSVLVYALIPALRLLGSIHATNDDAERATATLRRAIELASRTLDSIGVTGSSLSPDAPQVGSQLAQCRFLLAKVLRQGGEPEAQPLMDDARRGISEIVQRFPERADFRAILAEIRVAEATSAMGTDAPPAEVAAALAAGIADYRTLVALMPHAARHLRDLGAGLSNLAALEMRRGDLETACALAREAVEVQQRALASNPHDRKSRVFLRTHYNVLITGLARLRNHRALAEAAGGFARRFPDSGHVQQLAVEQLCGAMELAGSDAEAARAYGECATTILRAMVERGMTQPASLARSPSLAPLRGLESFRLLVEEK